MAKELPHPFLLELAQEYGLDVTSRHVFGRVNGVILATSKSETSAEVVVNLNHISESERAIVRKRLVKPKPKGLNRSELSQETGCLSISFHQSVFTAAESYRTMLKLLLDKIQEIVPPNPEGRIVLCGSIPLLADQLTQLQERPEAPEKSLTVRIISTLVAGLGLTLILSAIAVYFPRIGFFTTSPWASAMVTVYIFGRFIKGSESNRLNLLTESFTFAAIVFVVFGIQIVAFSAVSIPPDFRKTAALIYHAMDFRLAVTCLFQFLFLILCFLGLANRRRKWIPTELISLNPDLIKISEMSTRTSRKLTNAFLISILLFVVVIIASVALGDFKEETQTNWPIFASAAVLHFIYAALTYLWLRRDRDLRTVLNSKYRPPKSIPLVPTALLLPLMATAGSVILAFGLNSRFDQSPVETRFGRVGTKPVSIDYVPCTPVVSQISNTPVGIRICDSKTENLHTNEPVTYSYQLGALHTGRLYGVKSIVPSSWDELVKQVGDETKVRFADIERLLRDSKQRASLVDNQLPVWKKRCSQGEASYCRLTSYLIVEKEHLKDKQTLLKQGCNLGDRISCTGYLLLVPNDNWASEKAIQLDILNCKSGDLESCVFYFHAAKNGKHPGPDLIMALNRLCKSGDSPACDMLIWEENRL